MEKTKLYDELSQRLKRARKKYATLGRNLTVQDLGTCLSIRYYSTDIVCAFPDGSVSLHTGGYRTVRTVGLISKYLPPGYRIWSSQSVWWIGKGWNDQNKKQFQEGTTITRTGRLFVPRGPSVKAVHKLKKRVDEYCATFANKMLKGEIPAPGAGDCFYCYEAVGHRKAAGDIGGRPAQVHLRSHLKDKYYVPPMLLCALREKCTHQDKENEVPMFLRWPMAKFWFHQGGIGETCPSAGLVREEYEVALRRYFYRRLGISGNPKINYRRAR